MMTSSSNGDPGREIVVELTKQSCVYEIWICFIIIPIVIMIIILVYCLVRRILIRKKKKVVHHVSIRFPLPPPIGESSDDIMDETQYDVRKPALRDTKSKDSNEEGIGSTEIEADSREEQVPTIATMMREERREEPKSAEKNGKKKGTQLLFEAPPPYEQNIPVSPGRERMVTSKLANIPASTRTIAALRPLLWSTYLEPTQCEIWVQFAVDNGAAFQTQKTQASKEESDKDRKSLKENHDAQNNLTDETAQSESCRPSRRDPSHHDPDLAQTQQTTEDEETDIERSD
ncbi:unnamed protein product [Haemonchus placei]|uniref:Uncharacterized protein n=1 Tax=Haemonchus placei TaxID=6290 RepID=A0A0N4WFH2_HAEPC|nr:unnamed protein product [Haemonchus placei]